MTQQPDSARRERWHVSRFRQYAAALAGSTDVVELVRALDGAARASLADVHKTAFYVRDGESGLRLVHVEGVDEAELEAHESTAWSRHPGIVCRTMNPLLTGDARGSTDAPGSTPMRSRLFVPFVVGGHGIGAYGVASTLSHCWHDDDVAWLQALCDVGAVVWERLDAERARRDLEARAIEAQKLDIVERVVGTIAHDVNNALSVVLGTATRLQPRAADPGMARGLATIASVCERTAHLTRRLQSLSRPASDPPQVVRLGDELQRIAAIARTLVPDGVDVETRIHAPAACALLPAVQLEQMLLNLVLNSRDALAGAGTMQLGLEARTRDGVPGALLSVTDDGPGIPPELRARVFDPFFTTKARGQGTGLGLSSVRDLAEENGGDVRFVDVVRGARFEVWLPAASSASDPTRPLQRAELRRTLWIADDEPSLRELFADIGESAGWRTDTAGGGRQILEWLAEGRRPDVLVTDIVMPDVDGVSVAERVLDDADPPGIVLVTGYDSTARIETLMERYRGGRVELLNKPFSASQLLAAIDRVAPVEPPV